MDFSNADHRDAAVQESFSRGRYSIRCKGTDEPVPYTQPQNRMAVTPQLVMMSDTGHSGGIG